MLLLVADNSPQDCGHELGEIVRHRDPVQHTASSKTAYLRKGKVHGAFGVKIAIIDPPVTQHAVRRPNQPFLVANQVFGESVIIAADEPANDQGRAVGFKRLWIRGRHSKWCFPISVWRTSLISLSRS